jgi:hypothetical protein
MLFLYWLAAGRVSVTSFSAASVDSVTGISARLTARRQATSVSTASALCCPAFIL